MKESYRVSVDGWSENHQDREVAIRAARKYAEKDDEARVVVFNMFNNIIWEN